MERVIFSVIITTFNRPQRLRECITSVLNEFSSIKLLHYIGGRYELIIIDDGTYSGFILSEFSSYSQNIRYIKNNIKEGANASRLKGVNIALGDFIVFLDDDDLWLSGRFLELYHNHCILNSDCHFARFQLSGTIKSSFIRFLTKLTEHQNIFYSNFLGGFSIFSIRRRLLISNIELINKTLPSCQDWFLYISLFQNNKITKSFGTQKTVQYKVHKSGNITSSLINRYHGLLGIKHLLNKLDAEKKAKFRLLSNLFLLRMELYGVKNAMYGRFIYQHGSTVTKIKWLKFLFK
jgi:glycosyltransferase involved in cell wall biosynthesis